MKYDAIIQNPPYSKSLHLDFFKLGLDLLADNGRMVIIEPATWLINVRRNGKAALYDEIKRRIAGHVERVEIENLNPEFGTKLQIPFSTTVVDMSKSFENIDFCCCGEYRRVKSLYDCNLVGEYDLIWSILDKCAAFGDMMQSHVTDEKLEGDWWYAKYADIQGGCLCSGGTGRFVSDAWYRRHAMSEYYLAYSTCCYHSETTNAIRRELGEKRDRGGKVRSGMADNCVYGTKEELENWKYFVFNNKLPLFINICLTIDQHNNSRNFVPWLTDRRYTDDEINMRFGFTEEEIRLIDLTAKKFRRESPWFKRYMCGKDAASEDEIRGFLEK